MPLDEDNEHARHDSGQLVDYFTGATRAALVLAAFRTPYRGRSTPVNAWRGSFDLAVNLVSGLPADRRRPTSSCAINGQEVAIGWWPGGRRYDEAAFYAYPNLAPEGFTAATLPLPLRAGSRRLVNTS